MLKNYGPYKLLAGRHTEDEPRRTVKIKSISGNSLFTEDGERLFADLTSGDVQDRGEHFACYLGNRKMSCLDLREGDTVILAQPKTYTPQSEPFKSLSDLKARFDCDDKGNPRNCAHKFALVNASEQIVADQQTALSARDARIAELEAELARARAQPLTAPQDKYPLDALNNMSVSELRDIAASEEINLGKLSAKADIVAAIRAAL